MGATSDHSLSCLQVQTLHAGKIRLTKLIVAAHDKDLAVQYCHGMATSSCDHRGQGRIASSPGQVITVFTER